MRSRHARSSPERGVAAAKPKHAISLPQDLTRGGRHDLSGSLKYVGFFHIFLLLGLGLLLAGYVGWVVRWPILHLLPLLALAPLIPAAMIRSTALRERLLMSAVVAGGASIYLYTTALCQGRDLFLKWHDEFMLMLQAQMLAHGRLWMPSHPMADFFESFHILVKPVYASMYFPGTALMYVPAIWLHLPSYVPALLICGAVVGLAYLVVAEVVDPASGALAALMLVGVSSFRLLSTMVMQHPVFVLLALGMVWAWLRWRDEQRLRWAAVMGALAGWAALTRPVDAIAYAAPLAVCALLDLRGRPWRHWAATAGVALMAAAPFLGLQLIANRGITGNWLETPFTYTARLETPSGTYGSGDDGYGLMPQTNLQQKIDYHTQFNLPMIRRYRSQSVISQWLRTKLAEMLWGGVPNSALLVLAPLCLLMLSDRRRWVLLGTLPAFVITYAPMPVMLPHYSVDIAVGLALAVVLGAAALRQVSQTWHRIAVGAIIVLSLTALPEFNPTLRDDPLKMPTLTYLNNAAEGDIRVPAVVLFHYQHGVNFHEEPVYNVDAPWPDDAPIIRAHDLGPRNIEIFRYYAGIQPDRSFYLMDRATGTLKYLGTAAELAADSNSTTRTTPQGISGVSQ